MALVHLLLLAGVAHAQEPAGWAVAVAWAGEDADAATRSAARATEQLQSEGQRVLTGPALDQRIAAAMSRPFVPFTPSEQTRLETTTSSVAQAVTYGDDDGAIRSVTATVTDLADRLAAIGRDDANARRLTDLCLHAVRAHIHARQPDGARRQATECLRLVSDAQPPPGSHPADVRRLLEDERAALARNGARLDLTLENANETCRVRAQGRFVQVGAVLPPGAYQIQVECDEQPGRIHALTLAPGAALSIDASLDAALGNRDGLTLRYSSEAALRNRLPRHVHTIGSALRVANLLVVRPGDADTLMLERFRIDADGARRVASARVALSGTEGLPAAIDALVEGRSIDAPAGEGPVTGGGAGQFVEDGGGSIVGPVVVLGAGLVLVGTAAFGTLSATGCGARDPEGDCIGEYRPDWVNVGIVGGVGVAALAIGATWLVVSLGSDDEEETTVSLWPGGLSLKAGF